MIPSSCKTCGNRLSMCEMKSFLRACEENGTDPMAAARSTPPGINCTMCGLHVLASIATDEDHPMHKTAKEIARRMESFTRREEIGLRAVPSPSKASDGGES